MGGVTTPATLASLAHRGRLVVISAVGSRKVEIDLIDLYHNETRISARTAQSSVSLNPHGAWCASSANVWGMQRSGVVFRGDQGGPCQMRAKFGSFWGDVFVLGRRANSVVTGRELQRFQPWALILNAARSAAKTRGYRPRPAASSASLTTRSQTAIASVIAPTRAPALGRSPWQGAAVVLEVVQAAAKGAAWPRASARPRVDATRSAVVRLALTRLADELDSAQRKRVNARQRGATVRQTRTT